MEAIVKFFSVLIRNMYSVKKNWYNNNLPTNREHFPFNPFIWNMPSSQNIDCFEPHLLEAPQILLLAIPSAFYERPLINGPNTILRLTYYTWGYLVSISCHGGSGCSSNHHIQIHSMTSCSLSKPLIQTPHREYQNI